MKTERELFEEAFKKSGWPDARFELERDGEHYRYLSAKCAWLGWQLGRTAPPQEKP